MEADTTACLMDASNDVYHHIKYNGRIFCHCIYIVNVLVYIALMYIVNHIFETAFYKIKIQKLIVFYCSILLLFFVFRKRMRY